MLTIFYIFTFAISLTLNMSLWIYYKITDKKYVFDFFVVRMLSTGSLAFFLLGNFIKTKEIIRVSKNLDMFFEMGSSLFLFYFVYEMFLNKKLEKKYKLTLALLITVFFVIIVDLFTTNIGNEVLELTTAGLSFILILELLIILIFFIDRIDKKMKSLVILFIIYFVLLIFIMAAFESFFPEGFDFNLEMTVSLPLLIYICFRLRGVMNKPEISSEKVDRFQSIEFLKILKEHEITEREREIVILILKEMSNQEIADELSISVNTVKIHVYNIYRKFNINKRTELFNIL